jgi:ABC-2 type transport system ATP-binding protein
VGKLVETSHSNHAAIITCRNLTKVYARQITAVKDLSLEVYGGEIFGLLGPNGAGKTTTVGMLTTLVIPTQGTAIVAGIDVIKHPAQIKQLIGVVSQMSLDIPKRSKTGSLLLCRSH